MKQARKVQVQAKEAQVHVALVASGLAVPVKSRTADDQAFSIVPLPLPAEAQALLRLVLLLFADPRAGGELEQLQLAMFGRPQCTLHHLCLLLRLATGW